MDYLNRDHLATLAANERRRYRSEHPRSFELHEKAEHLFTRVPMTWMNKWPGDFPLGFRRAHGALVEDLDGNELVDFALGDTGAFAGHSPPALVEAVARRIGIDGA